MDIYSIPPPKNQAALKKTALVIMAAVTCLCIAAALICTAPKHSADENLQIIRLGEVPGPGTLKLATTSESFVLMNTDGEKFTKSDMNRTQSGKKASVFTLHVQSAGKYRLLCEKGTYAAMKFEATDYFALKNVTVTPVENALDIAFLPVSENIPNIQSASFSIIMTSRKQQRSVITMDGKFVPNEQTEAKIDVSGLPPSDDWIMQLSINMEADKSYSDAFRQPNIKIVHDQ